MLTLRRYHLLGPVCYNRANTQYSAVELIAQDERGNLPRQGASNEYP